MKIKKIVVELEKNDIVTILADSTCAYHYLNYECDETQKGYADGGECIEEKMANVLMNGGCIHVHDLNGDVDIDQYVSGKLKTKKQYKNCVGIAYDDGDDYAIPIYRITLKELTIACQRVNGYKYITALLNGTGDFWDAYNIMQLAMFNEEVYG